MTRFVARRTMRFVLIIVTAVAAVAAAETSAAAPGLAALVDRVGISPQFGAQIPLDAEFRDSTGKLVRLADCLDDGPVLLHLVYFECPMLCRLAGDGLLRCLSSLSLELGRDYRVITISFDPREGPELAARAKRLALEKVGGKAPPEAWRFLTGRDPAIREVCDAVGFRYAYDEARGQYAHASGVFVLTPAGKLSRYLGGVEFSPRDLRLALVDASAGNIGSRVDQVMLLCYMYDPATGTYGLAIITALRVAGAATVAILGGFIAVMIRRERLRRAPPASAAPLSQQTGAPP